MAAAPRRTPRPARAAWGTLSRPQVIDAAVRAIERPTGFERMTIRSLSADLGVAPMTLYRHVAGKDDILDEVADRLLAPVWRPRLPKADWQRWIAAACDRFRDLLVRQPAVLYVYLRHPVASPANLARMEAMLGVLRAAGFTEAASHRAYAALQTYTIGFAALEASREGWHPPDGELGPVGRRLAAFTTPQQFADGLAFLLEGLERHRQEVADDDDLRS